MNRRDFLKTAGVLPVVAGTLPLFNIGCAGFGFSRQRQIADGAKIRVALIGCGLQTTTDVRRTGDGGDRRRAKIFENTPLRGFAAFDILSTRSPKADIDL